MVCTYPNKSNVGDGFPGQVRSNMAPSSYVLRFECLYEYSVTSVLVQLEMNSFADMVIMIEAQKQPFGDRESFRGDC